MKRVIMTNQYGDEMCELKKNEYGFYELPELTVLFAVGDVLTVEEVWTEGE